MNKLRVVCLGIVLAACPAAARAQTGQVSEAAAASQARPVREQLTSQIVARWSNHIQEVYRSSADQWSWAMAGLFERASVATLQRAAQARTFDAMNDELLRGDGPATMAVDLGGAARIGDTATDLTFVPTPPCRVFDTRTAGGAIAAGATRDFDIADVANYSGQGGDSSNCNGLGAAGSFAAIAINLTVVTPAAGGFITAFPYNTSRPIASTLNYSAGDVRGNLAVVRLDQTAATPELSVYSFAQTHLVGDVVGYFIRPEATPLDCTQTTVSQAIGGNQGFDIQMPACPAGYTITGAGCRTPNFNDADWAINGLYAHPTFGVMSFCSGLSKQPTTITVEGVTQCCRLPGR